MEHDENERQAEGLSMRKLLGVIFLAASSCGAPNSDEEAITNDAEAAMSDIEAHARSDVADLTGDALVRACRAGTSFRGSEPPSSIKGQENADGTVRLSYVRKSDGKKFAYDCRVTGNEMSFRMIDERGPGTGAGEWSGRGSTVTFTPTDRGFEFNESYGPGDSFIKEIQID